MSIKSFIIKACDYKIIRYGCIGGISTLIHIIVAFLYLRFVADSTLFSNLFGFVVAFVFSYSVQSIYVFEHRLSFGKAKRYLVVQLGALALSILVAKLLPYNNYVRVLIVAFILPVATFFIHKLWTFQEPKEPKREST